MREMHLFQCSRLKPKELQQLQGQDLRSRAESMNFAYALAARIDGVYGDRFSAIKPFMDCISAREVRYDFCTFKRDVLSKRDVEVGAMLSDYYDKFYIDHKQYTFSEEDEEKYGYIKDGYFIFLEDIILGVQKGKKQIFILRPSTKMIQNGTKNYILLFLLNLQIFVKLKKKLQERNKILETLLVAMGLDFTNDCFSIKIRTMCSLCFLVIRRIGNYEYGCQNLSNKCFDTE